MCEEVTFYESNDEEDITEDNHNEDEHFAFNKSADKILFLGNFFLSKITFVIIYIIISFI